VLPDGTIYPPVMKLSRQIWPRHHPMIASMIVLILCGLQSLMNLTGGQHGKAHTRN
jgi:hypothetical protein